MSTQSSGRAIDGLAHAGKNLGSHHRRVKVPGDVAVGGYWNHYLCEYVDPPLTSVDLQHHQAAKAMVEAVQELIEQSPGAAPRQLRTIAIEPKVIRRVSA